MDAGPKIFTKVEDPHPDFDDGEAMKSMSEVRDYTQTLKQDQAAWTPVHPLPTFLLL